MSALEGNGGLNWPTTGLLSKNNSDILCDGARSIPRLGTRRGDRTGQRVAVPIHIHKLGFWLVCHVATKAGRLCAMAYDAPVQ